MTEMRIHTVTHTRLHCASLPIVVLTFGEDSHVRTINIFVIYKYVVFFLSRQCTCLFFRTQHKYFHVVHNVFTFMHYMFNATFL